MEILAMGMTVSIMLLTKSPNNKQKARFAITDITNQDFRKLLKEIKNSPYLGLNNKHVNNKPT